MKLRSKSVLLLCSAIIPFSVSSTANAQAAPSAFTTGFRYDAEHRLTGTIAPDPDGAGPLKFGAVRNTYDQAGRLIKVEKGELAAWQGESIAPSAWAGLTVLQTIDTSYDVLARKTKETLSGGSPLTVQTVTQFTYDTAGRLECTVVRMNPGAFATLPTPVCTLGAGGTYGADRITKNLYDAAGQLVQVREGVGTSVEAAEATYGYTPNGKREYVIDGEGNRAKLVHDGHDRLSQWIFPSKTKPTSFNDSPATALSSAGSVNTADYEQYGYDNNGNRTLLRMRDGRTIEFDHDALNRVTIKHFPGGTSADVGYTYDLRGLQLTATFTATGQGLTNGYNGFGELISAATNVGGTARPLTYQYDANGNRTRIAHPDTTYFTYDYDGLDRLTAIRENGGLEQVSLVYDPLGRRSQLARRNGRQTYYEYDAASRLSALTNT
ncbi:MAG: hypothetical protein ACJ8ET_03250, partial [Sphingomicrobium sp.]